MPEKTEQERVIEISKKMSYLAQIRQPFEAVVDNIEEFVLLGKKIVPQTSGSMLSQNVYDSYPVQAMDNWAKGFYAYDCASSLPWFKVTLPNKLMFPRWSAMRKYTDKRLDDIPEVSQWLSYVQEVLVSDFNRSNFYEEIIPYIKEGGGPGTAEMYCREDEKTGIMCFRPLHFREFFIAENRFRKVDTLFFKTTYTLKQMVEEFGFDQCLKIDPGFKMAYEQNPFQDRTVINAVYPREVYDPEKKDNKNKPWVSCWFQEGKTLSFLRESGYDYFPYISWRYSRMPDELYGRGWAWYAWADIATVNIQAKDNIEGGHKMINPPIVSIEILRGKVRRNAGGITYVDRITEDQIPRPLQEGVQIPFAVEMQDRMRQSIDKYSHADIFTMLMQAVMNKVELTATQVMHIAGEKAAMIASLTDSFNHGPLADIIDVMFQAAFKAGRLPDVPEILEMAVANGSELEIDFNGPLAQMQKTLFDTQPIRSGLAILAEIAQFDPQALMVTDMKEVARVALKATSFPPTAIRSREDLDAMIAQMQQQQQVQQGMAETIAAAKAVPAAGKEVSPQSPLGMIMGMNK